MLIVSGSVVPINLLSPELDARFRDFYLAFLGSGAIRWEELEAAAHRFFEQTDDPTQQDAYFNNFAPLWERWFGSGQWGPAEQLWSRVLKSAHEWEAVTGRRLHKGTPYYFQGVTAIMRGDLDRGYALVHQALEEDKNSTKQEDPPLPATAFVTMDALNQRQYFREWVVKQAEFVEGVLQTYRTSRASPLSFADLQVKFMRPLKCREPASLFAYIVARFMKFSEIPDYASRSGFVGQLALSLLLDAALVVDSAIKVHNTSGKNFYEHASYLAKEASLTVSKHLGEVATAINGPGFEPTLGSMLDGTWAPPGRAVLSGPERDLAVTYGVRNRGAHDVAASQTVGTRFEEVRQAVFNTLFLTVETLY